MPAGQQLLYPSAEDTEDADVEPHLDGTDHCVQSTTDDLLERLPRAAPLTLHQRRDEAEDTRDDVDDAFDCLDGASDRTYQCTPEQLEQELGDGSHDR